MARQRRIDTRESFEGKKGDRVIVNERIGTVTRVLVSGVVYVKHDDDGDLCAWEGWAVKPLAES